MANPQNRGDHASGSSTDGSPVSTPSHSPHRTPHFSDSPLSADSDSNTTTRNSDTPPLPLPIQRMSPHCWTPAFCSAPPSLSGNSRKDQHSSGDSGTDNLSSGDSGTYRNESRVSRNERRVPRESGIDPGVLGMDAAGCASDQEGGSGRRPQSVPPQAVSQTAQPGGYSGEGGQSHPHTDLRSFSDRKDTTPTNAPAPSLLCQCDPPPPYHQAHRHQHPPVFQPPPPPPADNTLTWRSGSDASCSPRGEEGGGSCVDRTGHQVTEDRQQIDVKSPRSHRNPSPTWPPHHHHHHPLPPHTPPSSPQKLAVRCHQKAEAERAAAAGGHPPYVTQPSHVQPHAVPMKAATAPHAGGSSPRNYHSVEPSPGSAFRSPVPATSPLTSPTLAHKFHAQSKAAAVYSDPSLTSLTLAPSQVPGPQWPTSQDQYFQPRSGATFSSYSKTYAAASSSTYASNACSSSSSSSSYYHYQSNEVNLWAGSSAIAILILTLTGSQWAGGRGEGRGGDGGQAGGGGAWRGAGQGQQASTNLDILLHKGGGDTVGINVIRQVTGGVSSVHVQDLTPGSLACRDGRLQRGDMLYSVNGRWLADMSLLDMFQLFRSLPPGPVRIRAARVTTTCMQRDSCGQLSCFSLTSETAGQLWGGFCTVATEKDRCQPFSLQMYQAMTATKLMPMYAMPFEDTRLSSALHFFLRVEDSVVTSIFSFRFVTSASSRTTVLFRLLMSHLHQHRWAMEDLGEADGATGGNTALTDGGSGEADGATGGNTALTDGGSGEADGATGGNTALTDGGSGEADGATGGNTALTDGGSGEADGATGGNTALTDGGSGEADRATGGNTALTDGESVEVDGATGGNTALTDGESVVCAVATGGNTALTDGESVEVDGATGGNTALTDGESVEVDGATGGNTALTDGESVVCAVATGGNTALTDGESVVCAVVADVMIDDIIALGDDAEVVAVVVFGC
ncbi:hypothetical protein ACOMHN_002992 [Nucella lapillus]